MKKRIILAAVCFVFVLTSCKGKEKIQENPMESPVSKPEVEQPKTGIPDEKCLAAIEKAAFIHLGDVVEDSYQGSIDCELDKEDIEALKEIKDGLLMEDTPCISFYNYKLTLYNDKKEVLDTWTVDTNYRIEAGNGYGISEDGKIKDWLQSIEKKHGVTYEEKCERAPGKNYLKMLDRAESINLMELTENNFIEGIDYDLEAEDIEELKRIKGEVVFGEEKKDFDEYYYKLTICTKAGAGLYFWAVDFDGRVYSNDYELKSADLRKWLDTIEKKAGLTEKREEK